MKHKSSLVILAAATLLPGAVGYSYAGTFPSFELSYGEVKEIYKNLASDSLNVTVQTYNPCPPSGGPAAVVKLTSTGKGGQEIQLLNFETKAVSFNVSKQQSIVADCLTSGCGPSLPRCTFIISVP